MAGVFFVILPATLLTSASVTSVPVLYRYFVSSTPLTPIINYLAQISQMELSFLILIAIHLLSSMGREFLDSLSYWKGLPASFITLLSLQAIPVYIFSLLRGLFLLKKEWWSILSWCFLLPRFVLGTVAAALYVFGMAMILKRFSRRN